MIDTLVSTIHDYQTLIASLIAILAAIIAYHNMSRQLQSTAVAAEKARAERRRAIAGALWAELTHSTSQLVVELEQLRLTIRTGGPLLIKESFDTSIFDAAPNNVADLDATQAYAVITSYKLIKNLRGLIKVAIEAPNGISADAAAMLANGFEGTIRIVAATTRDLAVVAGIPEEQIGNIRDLHDQVAAL